VFSPFEPLRGVKNGGKGFSYVAPPWSPHVSDLEPKCLEKLHTNFPQKVINFEDVFLGISTERRNAVHEKESNIVRNFKKDAKVFFL
jgi:hypothetical protein